MKPLHLIKNTRSFGASFTLRHTIVDHIYDIWHFHEELELNFVIRGKGTRFIGDSVQNFEDFDMVLVGSDLPHVWKNTEEYYQESSGLETESVVIQFLPSFLLEAENLYPEFKILKDLYVRSKRGLLINGKTKLHLREKIMLLMNLKGARRTIALLDILVELAECQESKVLASAGFSLYYDQMNDDKINSVFNYIVTNFKGNIILDDAASLANMNTTSFCRYFKSKTKKTFIEYVNDIRIGYACKLLIENKLNITEVCYESGFNSLSYFNRQFKSKTKISPKDYRKNYNKDLLES